MPLVYITEKEFEAISFMQNAASTYVEGANEDYAQEFQQQYDLVEAFFVKYFKAKNKEDKNKLIHNEVKRAKKILAKKTMREKQE